MSHQLNHMNLLIVEGPRLSNIALLGDTGAGLNLVNMDYHQSVAEIHPSLVLKFSHLKYLYNVDSLNIIGLDVVKES